MLVADKLHLAMIELMDNHWDKSVDYLKTMLTECHRFQYNDLYAEGALLLSKVYSLQGKYQLSKRTQDKVKNVIKKLDTVWLYEKIREFDRLYQRLVDLRIISKSKVSSEVPAVLKTQLAAHKDTHSYRRIIIGQSEPMYRVYNLLNKIAPTDLPVLIEGETGTGKELIARAIHGKSQRTGRNFFAFNCGA
ncbi:MAG: sigma 54-interacting transcriptional regulator, partial [Planctomycetes bacterium]|nr:sigma 54-interacting transcriptional regulator [Planctomycetota bacterium]